MTKMMQLPIEEATDDQIVNFAEMTLGLEIPPRTNRAKLLGLVSAAWDKPFITVPEPVEPNEEQAEAPRVLPQQRLEGGIGANDPKVILKLGSTELPGGKDPACVSVNGRNVVVQRGVRVEMPYRYFLALLDAKRGEVSQREAMGELSESEITNYPMEILERPSADEIAAWHARVDNELNPA